MKSFFYILLVFGACFAQVKPKQLQNISFEEHSEKWVLTLDVVGKANITSHFLEKDVGSALPTRYYIDLEPVVLKKDLSLPSIPLTSPILGLRVGQREAHKVRLVVDVLDTLTSAHFELKTLPEVGVRLSIHSALPALQMRPQAEPTREPTGTPAEVAMVEHDLKEIDAFDFVEEEVVDRVPKSEKIQKQSKPIPVKKRKFRIIVDAGHGGEDVGAIGPKGTYEKEVTLQISKKLVKQLEKNKDFEVYMTRQNDRTLKLSDRTHFANKMDGDLFVSVHANASHKRDASGISTYFLHNADDQESLRVAMRENGELAMPKNQPQAPVSEEYYLEVMKASMVKNFHTVLSTDLAKRVQESLVSEIKPKYKKVVNLGVKSARFFVLTGAKMPAILVETSFISNKEEEKRLTNSKYQEEMAKAIATGIEKYLKTTQNQKHPL